MRFIEKADCIQFVSNRSVNALSTYKIKSVFLPEVDGVSFFDSASAPPKSFAPHPLLLRKSWTYSSPPPSWRRKIENTTVTFWHVVWHFLMHDNMLILPHEANYCWSYSAFGWTWLVEVVTTHDLLSWSWRLQRLRWGCMDECCHGFSAGKLFNSGFPLSALCEL